MPREAGPAVLVAVLVDLSMSSVNAKSVVTEAQNKKHLKAIAELLKVLLNGPKLAGATLATANPPIDGRGASLGPCQQILRGLHLKVALHVGECESWCLYLHAMCRSASSAWHCTCFRCPICRLACRLSDRACTVQHISKVRSVTLDTWLPEQVKFMQDHGNHYNKS